MKKLVLYTIYTCTIAIALTHAHPPAWETGADHHLSAYAGCNRYASRPPESATAADAYAGSWGLDRAELSVTAHVGDTRNTHTVKVTGGTSITRHARGTKDQWATASARVTGFRTVTDPDGDIVEVRRWFGRQAKLAPADD